MYNKSLNIVVIFGTSSLEHNISLRGALNVSKILLELNKYNLFFIGITKTNIWKYSDNINDIIIDNNINENCKQIFQIGNGKINNIKIDCAFLTTHGKIGEDGILQGYLDMNQIPYTGSDVRGSSFCFNKNITKYTAQSIGINVVPYIFITKKTFNSEILIENIKNMGEEFVVKINCGGSSIGVFYSTKKDILENIYKAFELDDTILVEKYIKAYEISIGLIEKNNELILSSIKGNYYLNNAKIYDYKTKYLIKSEKISLDISKELKKKISDQSIELFNTLHLKSMARIDYFFTPEDNMLYLNEINTLPGINIFSNFTLLFRQLYDYQELIDTIIENIIENNKLKK